MTLPLWRPQTPENSRLWAFMRFASTYSALPLTTYAALYAWSIQYPERFWETLYRFFNVHFTTPPLRILNQTHDFFNAKWFEGATFNVAEHLLRREDDHAALICINEQQERTTLSYRALRDKVAQCAAGLKAQGVNCGDRVVGILPNSDYAIIALLATAAIGAIWSSCSPDFGMDALLDRITQLTPKVILISDGQWYNGKRHRHDDKIASLSLNLPSLSCIVVCPVIHHLCKTQQTCSWDAFLVPHRSLTFTQLPFDHPFVILFSSGTTGKPKGIIHGAGGTFLQHLKELGLHTDLHATDRFCFYTTCGWMMWNWMVSGLAFGATLVLYDGSPTYPHSTRLFELVEQEGITQLGTSAKLLSTIAHDQKTPRDQYDLHTLKTILSTGSPLLPEQYDFVYQHIKTDVQLSSISGGTDIISCFALGNPLLPVYPGELQCLGLGMHVAIFDETGHPLPPNTRGELVCLAPFPSMPVGFWQDSTRQLYHQAYFQRFKHIWAHGDFASITAHQGLIIYGRSDTLLNPGGVRIGTAEIYRQIETISDILDSVVIGQQWQNDTRIVLFVKLKPQVSLTPALEHHIRQVLRTHASPRHVPAKIIQVKDIPRTLNGKIVERAVSQIVHHQPVAQQQTLANPESLDEFKNRVELMD